MIHALRLVAIRRRLLLSVAVSVIVLLVGGSGFVQIGTAKANSVLLDRV